MGKERRKNLINNINDAKFGVDSKDINYGESFDD